MLTCKEAAALISQSFDRRLRLHERWSLRLHLFVCEACTRFKRQAEFLHAAAKEYARRGIEAAQQLRLSAGARTRIQKALPRDRE